MPRYQSISTIIWKVIYLPYLDRTNKFCPCPPLTLRDRGVEKLRWISKANWLEGRAKILSTAEREALDLAKGWSFSPNIGHTVVTSFVLKKETTFKMKWLNWGIPWLFRVFLMRSTLCYWKVISKGAAAWEKISIGDTERFLIAIKKVS